MAARRRGAVYLGIGEVDDRFATTPICLAGLLLPFIPEAERLVMELTAP